MAVPAEMAATAEQLAIAPVSDEVHSTWSMFWWRMRHNVKAMLGGAIVVALLLIALLAPLIAPKDPTDGELSARMAAMSSAGLSGGRAPRSAERSWSSSSPS